MSLSAPSQWLADELTALLSAPHTDTAAPHDITNAPQGAAAAADSFSTRFDRIFVRHARGLVGGREVDLAELKRALLALQQKWNPAQCRYEDCEALHRRIEGFHPEMGVRMQFIPMQTNEPHVVVWEACVAKQRGSAPRIKTLMLDGDPFLFQLQS